jgi:hypothetical protein
MESNIVTAGRYGSFGGERNDGCMNHLDSFINKLHQEGGTARHKKNMWTSSWAVQKRTKLNLEIEFSQNISPIFSTNSSGT